MGARKLYELLLQRAGRGFRMVGGADGADDGHTFRPRLKHSIEILLIDPTDADTRVLKARLNVGDQRKSHASVVGLGRRRENRPQPKIINLLRVSRQCLLKGVR